MAPAYSIAHRKDDENEDCPEIVGSKDLRESFKDGARVRGSFFINGYEFHQFESNGIENLIALLNAKQSYTHVRASIDDGYHLVLEANSPAPISIRGGAAYVETPAAGGGDAAEQVLQRLKTAADKDEAEDKASVLDALGLEATEDDVEAPVVGMTPAGPTAEERKKAREDAKTGSSPSAGTAGQTDEIPTNQSAPITGSGDGAKMADGRDRTGQGAGYSTKPDGTPLVRGTPAYEAGQGTDPAANVQHRPAPQG